MQNPETLKKTTEYVRPMPATWWLRNRYLFLFLIRELTSLFVAGYAVFLIIVLYQAEQDREKWRSFFTTVLRSPLSMVLHLIALAFVVYHSVTSFHAAPQIIVIRRGEEKVSPALIIAANYALWLIVSAAVLVIAIAV